MRKAIEMKEIDFDKVKYPESKAINIDNATLEYCDIAESDLVKKIAKAEAKKFDNAVLDICQGIARVVFCGREVEIDRRKLTQMLLKQVPKTVLPDNRYYGGGRCPSCLAVFLDNTTNYCGNCGQKLDWGQEE